MAYLISSACSVSLTETPKCLAVNSGSITVSLKTDVCQLVCQSMRCSHWFSKERYLLTQYQHRHRLQTSLFFQPLIFIVGHTDCLSLSALRKECGPKNMNGKEFLYCTSFIWECACTEARVVYEFSSLSDNRASYKVIFQPDGTWKDADAHCSLLVCVLWVQTGAGQPDKVLLSVPAWTGFNPATSKLHRQGKSHWSESTRFQAHTQMITSGYCSLVLVQDECSESHAPFHKMTEQHYQEERYEKFCRTKLFVKVLLSYEVIVLDQPHFPVSFLFIWYKYFFFFFIPLHLDTELLLSSWIQMVLQRPS